MADVPELVGHHRPHLVSVVAVEQRVEQHDPLARAQTGDISVGRRRAPAGVDRVHLPHLDPGRAGQFEHVRARLALGQRREVVEDRVQDHRGHRGQAGAEQHRARGHRGPPGVGEPAGGGDYGGSAPGREHGLDRPALDQIARPAAPGLGVEPGGDGALARERAQRQRRGGHRDRQHPADHGAPNRRPLPAASQQSACATAPETGAPAPRSPPGRPRPGPGPAPTAAARSASRGRSPRL